VFALDVALIRAVDALDTYMMRSHRRPCALNNALFAARMDATGQSVAKRLEVFSEFLPVLSGEQLPFLKLAIDWRNRRVHSLAVESLQRSDEATLLASAQKIEADHKGLSIKELLGRFKTGSAPAFKDAASIISLVHRVVQHFDARLLSGLDIERYVRESLRVSLAEATTSKSKGALKRACVKIWGDPRKKRAKVLRALRWIGVHGASTIEGRQVPDDMVDEIAAMSAEEAWSFLGQTE
jgi:hypothetical protein